MSNENNFSHKTDVISRRTVLSTGIVGLFSLLEAACNNTQLQQPILSVVDKLAQGFVTGATEKMKIASSHANQLPNNKDVQPTTVPSATSTQRVTETPVKTATTQPAQEVTPTQETVHPTELGTLAKVKIGKTEVIAGVDINMNLNLWGTNTPVRLVASHGIGNLQADTWYTQTVNGKAPQEILRTNLEQILNLRATGNRWGITRGNGLRPTEVNLPPGTKLVFIFGSYEDFGKTILKADPMANNDKVATEYDVATKEFRVIYRGGSQDNIQKRGQSDGSDGYGPQYVLGEIYTVWSVEAMLNPAVSDDVIMNPDLSQLRLINTIKRAAFTDTPFIHFVPPKSTPVAQK